MLNKPSAFLSANTHMHQYTYWQNCQKSRICWCIVCTSLEVKTKLGIMRKYIFINKCSIYTKSTPLYYNKTTSDTNFRELICNVSTCYYPSIHPFVHLIAHTVYKLTNTLAPSDSHQHPSTLCVWTLSQFHIHQEQLDHLQQLKLILLHPPVCSPTRVQWAAECNEHMDRVGSVPGGIAQYLCMQLVFLRVLQNTMWELFSLCSWKTWRELFQLCLDTSQFFHSVYEMFCPSAYQ